MIVQFSHLVLLFLAVQAIAANQGGVHHGSFPSDPSRLNPSPSHQQHQYSYQQGNQQSESVHSQQPPQQAPQQSQQLPPHLSMGRNMQQQSASTPPGFGNQQQSNFYRPPGSFYSPQVHQQPQSLGIFARIKNSLTSASSAIQNALDFPGNEEDSSSQYAASVGPMGTPGGYPQSDRRYVPGSIPPSSAFGVNVPPGMGQRSSYPGYTAPLRDVNQRSYHPQQQQPPENSNEGFMGKVRNIFSGEQSSAQQQRTEPYRSYPPVYHPPSTGQPLSQKANMNQQYEMSHFHQPQTPSMQQHASHLAPPTGQIEDQQAQQQFQHYP